MNEQIETLFESIHTSVQELQDVVSQLEPEEYELELSSRLISRNRFVPEIRKSGIPLSGNGLFVKGSVVYPGTVVAIFPGKVHLAQYLTNEYVNSQLLPDQNLYLMGRLFTKLNKFLLNLFLD